MKEIQLSQGKLAIVDDNMFDELSSLKWCYSKRYALTTKKGAGRNGSNFLYMHRYITNCPDEMEVDHINGNGLDNRKCNLRICTHSENMMNSKKQANNSSGYKGVYWNKQKKLWHVQISVNNKTIFVGRFSNKESAALAYDDAAKKHYGDFASTNF